MIQLQNGCSCSQPKVSPLDWKTVKASTKKNWYIHYRFYDPTARERWPEGKPVQVKGMNSYKDLKMRQEATQAILDNEKRMLTQEGYNPITGNSFIEEQVQYEIDPVTPFILALRKAKDRIGFTGSTLSEIDGMLNAVEKAACNLRYEGMEIALIKRRHIKNVLAQVARNNPKFSSHGFNKYRSYLMSIYKELVELDAVESNPLKDIAKKKTTKRLRLVLDREERTRVNQHLKSNYYSFWRFSVLFFHSGGRMVELLALKVKDVDLKRQRYKGLIKKGREYKEIERTIKDVALPLWIEAVESGNPDDYVFSVGLVPGAQNIRREQISRRWQEHVKKKLGIKPDFYSLKHLNLDETASILSASDAAKQAGHTTPVVTIDHYLINESERQHEKLRKVNNSFAG